MKKIHVVGAALLVSLLGAITTAQAAVITSTLGNSAPGFNDGDTPPVFLVGGAQGGQPAPFDQSYGTDGLFGGNFSAAWTHSYGAIADTILSATITFGIVDHDSAASGSQLAGFSFEGANLTAPLDLMFEAAGEGADAQYDIYSLVLPNITFAGLADGLAAGALSLQGPGLVPNIFTGGVDETSTNGANLIFSTLQITTRETQQVPEPSTLAISLLGLGALGWRQRRRRV